MAPDVGYRDRGAGGCTGQPIGALGNLSAGLNDPFDELYLRIHGRCAPITAAR